MKKYIYTLIIVSITLFSCQEVVDVDLKTAQERLVIEAMIQWEKGTTGNEQIVKLSKTSSFYNNQIVKATGATVTITNKNTLEVFNFTETEDGIYTTTTFEPIINDNYELVISYNGETYKAEETLFASPDIIEVTQSVEDGFFTDEPEINVSFQDFLDQEDFYRISFDQYRPSTDEIIDNFSYTYDASFEENNVLSNFYESENIEVGDEFLIRIYKVSEQFYNFINVLEEQGEESFGPFSSPPVNVKGNCINTTTKDHYPYGYFGLNQISAETYTFE